MRPYFYLICLIIGGCASSKKETNSIYIKAIIRGINFLNFEDVNKNLQSLQSDSSGNVLYNIDAIGTGRLVDAEVNRTIIKDYVEELKTSLSQIKGECDPQAETVEEFNRSAECFKTSTRVLNELSAKEESEKYIVQSKGFTTKVLGYFSIRNQCKNGDSQKPLTKLLQCFQATKADEAMNKSKKKYLEDSAQQKKDQEEAERQSKIQQGYQKMADGGDILENYCKAKYAYEMASATIKREQEIGRESGAVDLEKLRNNGNEKIGMRDYMKTLEANYQQRTGKQLSKGSCPK